MGVSMCASGAVVLKAGANASTTVKTETFINGFINQAEGVICNNARYDFVANSGSLSVIGKEFLEDVCSSLAAIYVINYDMSGFTSRAEAQTMLDVNWTIVREGLNLLRDDNFVEFVKRGTTA